MKHSFEIIFRRPDGRQDIFVFHAERSGIDLLMELYSTLKRMEEYEMSALHATIGQYIRNNFGLLFGSNEALMESCRFVAKKYDIHYDLHEDDASALIVRELWEALRETHLLKIVR